MFHPAARRRALGLSLVAVLGLAACGSSTVLPAGSGGGGGGGGAPPIASCEFGADPTVSGVCAELACVACEAEASCDPFGFSTRWASPEECQSRTVLLCKKQLAAPGVNATLESFSACAQGKAALSCADYLAERWPASCELAPGAVADGGACGFDAQCAAGFCHKEFHSSTCGVCRPPAAGDDCNEHLTSCGPGLVCIGGTCVAYGGPGADCTGLAVCEPSLVCSAGTCAAPQGAGQPCLGSYGDDDCDRLHGLACDELSLTCKPIPVAGTGGSCGQLASSDPMSAVQPVCGPESSCIVHDSPPGSCEARPADGESCVQSDPTANARSCRPPALCADGLCTVADPAACQ